MSSERLTEVKAPGAPISPTHKSETGGKIRVVYGIHALSVGVAGKTVSEVREALGQAFNISPRSIALVDGQEVAEAHTLLPGQHLEFVRQSGEKGGFRDVKSHGLGLRREQHERRPPQSA